MKFLAILLLAALTAEVVVAAPGKLSRSKRHDDPTEHDEWASSGWGSDYSDDDYYEGSGASPWDGDDEAEGFEEKDEGTTPEKVEAGQVSGSGDLFFNASQEVPDMMAFNASGMPGSMAFNVSQVMAGLMPFNMSQGMPDMMPFNLSQGFPGMIPGQMPFNLSQGFPGMIPGQMPFNLSQGIPDLTSFFNKSSGMSSWTVPNMSFVMPGNMPANMEGEMPPGIAEMLNALQQLLGTGDEDPEGEGYPQIPGFSGFPSTPPPSGSQPPVVINYFALTNTTFNIMTNEDGS